MKDEKISLIRTILNNTNLTRIINGVTYLWTDTENVRFIINSDSLKWQSFDVKEKTQFSW